jgi:antitoxin component YwqK of YwqJK toxin-antitoxin module
LIGFISCQKSNDANLSKANDAVKVILDVEVDKNMLILNQLEGRWYYNDLPFNGYAVSYHENEVKAESIGYYDGKKEGVARKWFPTKMLQKESYYSANKLVGIIKSWWPNGLVSSEAHYKNGMRHGIQKIWYANGQLARQTTIVNGKEEGMQQAWLENGKIYVNYEAKNGRVFGLKKANLCYELEDEVVQNQ